MLLCVLGYSVLIAGDVQAFASELIDSASLHAANFSILNFLSSQKVKKILYHIITFIQEVFLGLLPSMKTPTKTNKQIKSIFVAPFELYYP